MNNELNTVDDEAFLKFIKANLERDAAASPESHAAIRAFAVAEAQRRKVRAHRKRFALMFAMAAGLAVVFGIGIIAHRNIAFNNSVQNAEELANASVSTAADDLQIVRVIELLEDSENPDREIDEGMDATEILLAWQDAPFNRIEEELEML